MSNVFRPAADWELANLIAYAAARKSPPEIVSSVTKRSV